MWGPWALGFWLFPLPVKLDAYLGDAIIANSDETAEAFTKRVQEATQKLIDKERDNEGLDDKLGLYRHIRKPSILSSLLSVPLIFMYGLISLLQNTFFHIITILIISCSFPIVYLTYIIFKRS